MTKRYIGAHINQDLYEAVKEEAQQIDRPMRYVIEQALEQYMETKGCR